MRTSLLKTLDSFSPETIPEKRLAFAVIYQALLDARSSQKYGVEARRWLRRKTLVCFWLELADIDTGLYPQLLAAMTEKVV